MPLGNNWTRQKASGPFRYLAGVLAVLFLVFGVASIVNGGDLLKIGIVAMFWGIVFLVVAIRGYLRKPLGSEN